jgi:4-hydroxy-tetrahydrodipicolinate reductase
LRRSPELIWWIITTGRLSGVYRSGFLCGVEADAIIDFSNFRAVDGILDFAKERKIPLVLCTTGLTEEQLAKVEEYSREVAILRSANMSLGINLAAEAGEDGDGAGSPIPGYDIEIVEEHHNRKLDAPSGTALALADSINEASGRAVSLRL